MKDAQVLGHLDDSVTGACDPRSRGHKFEPNVGCTDYLKVKFKKIRCSVFVPMTLSSSHFCQTKFYKISQHYLL